MIIKKPHIIILLLLFARMAVTVSFAQGVVYFDKRYDLSDSITWDFSVNIIGTEDGYIVLGQTGPTHEFMYWYRIGLTKIDKNGNQVWRKNWGDTLSEYAIGYPGCMIRNTDDTYYMAGTKRTWTADWVHDQGMLVKYNRDLDTLQTWFYGEKTEPYDTAYMMRQVRRLENGDLVLTGNFMAINDKAKVYLLKTNSIGKPLWDKIYYYGYYIYPYSIELTSDKGFVLGTVRCGTTSQDTDPIIIKTDSAGNQQWTKNLGSYFADYCSLTTISKDSNIVAGVIWADSASGIDYYWGRVHIVKMDNAGNVIWDKKYGGSHFDNIINNIRCLSDGSLIATGYYVLLLPYDMHTVGWILKTNSEGDSLWMRQYDLLQVPESYNGLFDIIATDDGGYIACGDVWPYPPDTGTQDVWVVKMDSIGCPYPECDTTVGIIPLIPPAKTKLNVYPNPAIEEFTVSGLTSNIKGRKIVRVTDMYGRTVKEISVPDEQDEITVNATGMPPGIYIGRLMVNNASTGSIKFIIHR